jgi:acylphosphatase
MRLLRRAYSGYAARFRAVTDQTLALQLTVRGRVQGVFFRDSTRREAERRELAGWAANRPDGSVEVVLEGRAEDVRELAAWCRHGPRGAEVMNVEEREREVEGLRGFLVR